MEHGPEQEMQARGGSPTQAPEEYDVLVLGSGEPGKYIAWTFAKKGLRTAVIERKYVGGSCPNIACLPSKNVIQSAKVASYFRRSEEFGITRDNFRINMSAVRDRKRRMVDGLIQLHLDNYRRSGAELIMGSGRFVAAKTLEVALPDRRTRLLRGDKIIIGTGTRAKLEQIPGLSESSPLTHIEALELDHVPEHPDHRGWLRWSGTSTGDAPFRQQGNHHGSKRTSGTPGGQ